MRRLFSYSFLKSFLLTGVFSAFIWIAACTSENKAEQATDKAEPVTTTAPAETAPAASDKGTGPISNVELAAAPDTALVSKGKSTFEGKCSACHKFGERYVGPDLAGVTTRRKPEWIMNMILNPQEMLQKDAVAQELLAQFMTQMPNQNLTEEEARAVLEYFRTK